jgi:hypothetical protein
MTLILVITGAFASQFAIYQALVYTHKTLSTK